ELAQLASDEVFSVYSVDASGKFVVGEGRHARVTRQNAELVEVTLDNGARIRCTTDHRFMLRDGTYKQAQHLTTADSLMPGNFDGDGHIHQPAAEVATALYNHSVVSVGRLAQREDVYDITVDEHHNFLLASGVFVHNSLDDDPPAAM